MVVDLWWYRRRFCCHHLYASTRPRRRRSSRTGRNALSAADRRAGDPSAETDPQNAERNRWPAPIAYRLAAGLSAIVPVVLISAVLLGFAGYLNLAWSATELLVWLLVIGGVWVLLLVLLRDGTARLRHRLTEGRGELGDFWVADFFDPAYRLIQFGLTLGAGWALFSIYGWTAETPAVRHLLAFGRV